MFSNYTLWNVASVFFTRPNKEFTIADLKRETKLTYPALKPKLDTLVSKNIIFWEQHKKITRTHKTYKANAQHEVFVYWKRTYNLFSLKPLTDYLRDTLHPDVVVLFGSYGRGEDDENSDIDIFIQANKKDIDIARFEKELHKEIQVFIEPDIGNLPDSLQQNIRSANVLYGAFTNMTRQKRTPDKPLASHMRLMTTHDLQALHVIPREYTSIRLRMLYDALRTYAEAYGVERGIRFRGEGAHYDLFEYLREQQVITEDERILLQTLRDVRNKNAYEGKDIPPEFLDGKEPEIQRLLNKLREL